jgi:hypothetical protein
MLKASSVFLAAVSVAIIVPLAMAAFGIGIPNPPAAGYFDGQAGSIQDPRGDAQPVLQRFNTSTIPEVKDYHDVISAGVRKADGLLELTINLAGNPNLNEKYETNYMWNVIYSNPDTGRAQNYVVMVFNFAPDFNHTAQGWHYAVFDRTGDIYVLPQAPIGNMPEDRVEFDLDGTLIGNPSSFQFWVSVYTRVNSTSFDGPPEYLMDYAP